MTDVNDTPDSTPRASLDFEAVMASAKVLPANASNEEIRQMLQMAIDTGITPAEEKMLIDALKATTGEKIGILTQMLTDQKNTILGIGTVSTVDQAARATLDILRKSYEGVVFANGGLHVYGEKGNPTCWSRQSPDELLDYVSHLFSDRPVAPNLSIRKQICRQVEGLARDDDFFAGEVAGANTMTGLVTIDPATGEIQLVPHSPDHRKCHVLGFGYDPEATCPTFLAGLDRTLGDDPAKVLNYQENVGSSLVRPIGLPDNARTVVFKVGHAGCGKSAQLKIVEALHPPAGVTSFPPSQWGDEYVRAVMAGASINVVYELGADCESEKIKGRHFKAMAANERVSARHPGGRPFTFEARFFSFIAANTLPATDDKTGGFGRRVSIIEYARKLAPEDRDGRFIEKCKEELPGILNWALAGAQRLIGNGHYTLPADQERLLLEMQFPGDLVEHFVRLAVERIDDPTVSVSVVELRAALRRFTEARGHETSLWSDLTYAKALAERLKAVHGAVHWKSHGLPMYRHINIKEAYRAEVVVPTDDIPNL